MESHNTRDHGRDPARLRPLKFVVLKIDVVDQFANGVKSWVVQASVFEQNLECTKIALVRELTLEHVEAELDRRGRISIRIDKPELRSGVYEAPDQPRARHAIHLDAAARYPSPVFQFGERRLDGRLAGSSAQGTFDIRNHCLQLHSTWRTEKI